MTSDSFIVNEEEDGLRLDKLLTIEIPGYSRSYLQGLLKDGNVLVNGKSAKASMKMKENDAVSFSIPDKILPDIVPENLPLDVLYEDKDVLVVNKPKGMVVHPAPGHYRGTLVNAIMYHCGESLSGINGVMRPGIVHRIDRDTTGSVIICKNDLAHQSIAAQLKEHSIVRRYVAICYGVLKEDDLTITGNIGRDRNDRKKMAVVSDAAGSMRLRMFMFFSDLSSIRMWNVAWKPAAPIRFASIWLISAIRFLGMKYTPETAKVRLSCRDSACTPVFWASIIL